MTSYQNLELVMEKNNELLNSKLDAMQILLETKLQHIIADQKEIKEK
jgi:hypothetical protein